MKQKIDTRALAEAEIEWWEAYHRRDWNGLEKAVKELREKQYGVEVDDKTAREFVSAAEDYIQYRKALARNDDKLAKNYLRQAEEHMERHYEGIDELLDERKGLVQ